jgi:hypothetical protein
MEIFIPENVLNSIDKKEDLIQKIIWKTKNNYLKYDERLIHKIVKSIFDILADFEQSSYHNNQLDRDNDRKVTKEEQLNITNTTNVISISELNELVIMSINRGYTQKYYINKILYDSIILNIYGNLFKAHGFIDDIKIFLEKYDYFTKEQSCWWKNKLGKTLNLNLNLNLNNENENKNILQEAPVLLNYYNFYLHAKNLFENPKLQYTLDLVSNILENKIYISGSGRKIETECRIILYRSIFNIEINSHKSNYIKKVKKVKKVKKITSKCYFSDYLCNLEKKNVNPIFNENNYSTCNESQNSLMSFLIKTKNDLPNVKTIYGLTTKDNFDLIEEGIFKSMYGAIYDSFQIEGNS